jgi:hypothetical protein
VLNSQVKNNFPITFKWYEISKGGHISGGAWYVEINANRKSETQNNVITGSQCIENLPLYEQSVMFLNSSSNGLTANEYRDALGVSHKRAMR